MSSGQSGRLLYVLRCGAEIEEKTSAHIKTKMGLQSNQSWRMWSYARCHSRSGYGDPALTPFSCYSKHPHSWGELSWSTFSTLSLFPSVFTPAMAVINVRVIRSNGQTPFPSYLTWWPHVTQTDPPSSLKRFLLLFHVTPPVRPSGAKCSVFWWPFLLQVLHVTVPCSWFSSLYATFQGTTSRSGL